jgi:hypothetical protein
MWNEIALEELDENTNKSTKFCFNKRTKWKYEQKYQILVEIWQDRALAREYDLDGEVSNFVMLIINK